MTKNVTINNKIEIYKTYDNNYEGQDIDHDKKQDLVHCCNIFPFHLDGDQYRGPNINDRDRLVGLLSNKDHDNKQQNQDM